MNLVQYLLTKLTEECGEVVVEACKASQFGYEDSHPKYVGTNRERLHAELDDIAAVISLLNDQGLNYIPNWDNIQAKKAKVLYYEMVARKNGGVS